MCGILCIITSKITALALILMLPTPPQTNRLWRLFPVLFATCGTMFLYCTWRGYCPRCNGKVQMRVWELQDVEDDRGLFWTRILSPNREVCCICKGTRYGGSGSADIKLPFLEDDRSAIAPFIGYGEPFRHADHSVDFPPPLKVSTSLARNGFLRPPIFGPERVVLDPRIKAVHNEVLYSIFYVGFLACVLSSALLFPIPGWNRRH
jgi:hypothetical protein